MGTERRKIRLLCVTATLGGGGAEMHLLRLLNALDRRDFELGVAVTRAGGSYEKMLAPDVSLFKLGPAELSSAASIALAVPRLRALVRSYQPSVVCSVMDHVNLATLLAMSGLRSRPPLILCVQINPAPVYDGRRTPLAVAIRLAIRHLYQRADRVVALSRGVAHELVLRNPRLASTVSVIPNAAIDDFVLRAAEKPLARGGVPPQDKLVVACGRLTEQKGYPDLLDAIALARKELPVHLWILGEGPDRARLQERARSLGLSEHVEFLGFQPEPWRYMAAADVFALSSLYEGFGNVVVEAMASGVPVVSTDCPYGPGEVITDGKNGVLVPPGNPRAMADALLRVLSNPSWAAELATKGRERAADFSAGTIADSYATVIRDVARRAPPAHAFRGAADLHAS